MIRLIWRTDAHLSDRTPASRKDDWTEVVMAKLEQVRLVANKVKASAVIDGGDFFHIKSPSRNSHKLVHQVAEHHAGYNCPVYCTPGNHDSVYGDYAFLEQQPLGVLYATKVFQRLYDEHEVYFADGRAYTHNRSDDTWPDGHIPTSILEDTTKPIVRVVGVPYHGTKYDMGRFESIKKGEEDHLVVVAHVLASPKGGSMFENEDVLKYADLAKLDPDMWLLGHWHKDQGVQIINGKRFVNIGSMTRGSLSQDDVDRRPAIAMLTFSQEGIQVQVLRLRAKPSVDVFDIDAKVRAEARTMTMDAFVSSVKGTLLSKREQSLEEDVEGLDGVPVQVRERALSYLERA